MTTIAESVKHKQSMQTDRRTQIGRWCNSQSDRQAVRATDSWRE